MSSDLFSASNPAERVATLLDPGSFRAIARDARCALTAGTGTVDGTGVAIAATDRDIAGGSFGVVESQALSALFSNAGTTSAGNPVSGFGRARLDEGLPALGAFRQLIALSRSQACRRVSTLAFLGRDCLAVPHAAATCGRRIYLAASRLAMSGPAVIQALGGRQELDPKTRRRSRL